MEPMVAESPPLKKFNLALHSKREFLDDVIINIKELEPGAQEGDVIEIYDEDLDKEYPRLLLQISKVDADIAKDTIRVEQNIAKSFQLKKFKDVVVNKVDTKSVTLDLINLTFKDQYLGRSDMWRLKKSLVNTVVYKNKKVEFCGGSLWMQVYEMWANGEKVACGYVSEDTKVVFRSSTSMVYLFIQMSSEMWEFDRHGDLYFEKAVNGFLADLFAKWKSEGSNHEVTIVLFSRIYYRAQSLEDFPQSERECLQEDYFGRFYEDFYRVAIQNERFDDWTPMLSLLRRHFVEYSSTVLKQHNAEMPEAFISRADQGNFLEVLNISLNVFDKHYLDRSFERTGQMSVVITPGVGVFEVDRELANITKHRIIDNGVGSDLVCLGEQPLHAVPLLKFHKQRGSVRADDYSMPHTWINLSFYSSSNKIYYNSFIPRIKVPEEILVSANQKKICLDTLRADTSHQQTSIPHSVLDYDNYDAQVFKLPMSQNQRKYSSLQRPVGSRKKTISQSSAQPPPSMLSVDRKLSDPELFRAIESGSGSLPPCYTVGVGKSLAINIPARITEHMSQSIGALNIEGGMAVKANIEDDMNRRSGTSAGTSPSEYPQPQIPGKRSLQYGSSLINPFDPSHMKIKITSNRRRWIHIFPKSPTGVLIQHHHQTEVMPNPCEVIRLNVDHDDDNSSASGTCDAPSPRKILSAQQSIDSDSMDVPGRKELLSPLQHPIGSSSTYDMSFAGMNKVAATHKTTDTSMMWGATGEQQWDAEITTGVDWKSLILPACLPLTTDYFPSERSLSVEHEVASNYHILPTDPNDQVLFFSQKIITPQQVFHELVSQRLAQGFQLCIDQDTGDDEFPSVSLPKPGSFTGVGGFFRTHSAPQEEAEEYQLSIGRVYHKLKLSANTISISIYRPKHPNAQLSRRYKYRFRAPDMGKYVVSKTQFTTEMLENYKWSYLDNYICNKGESCEFPLEEGHKYWRVRLIVVSDAYKSFIKSQGHFDKYKPPTQQEKLILIKNFVKFMKMIHKIKKPEERGRESTVQRDRLCTSKISEHISSRGGAKLSDHSLHDGNEERKLSSHSSEDRKMEEDQCKWSVDSPHSVIVEAMKDTSKGMTFINSPFKLPLYSFISADATFWVKDTIQGIVDEQAAIQFLQEMVNSGHIAHVTGKKNYPFLHGFFLYYICDGSTAPNYDSQTFKNEWHQVSISTLSPESTETNSSKFAKCPDFLLPNVANPAAEDSKFLLPGKYEIGRLDVDVNNKSERNEWGHLKHRATFTPEYAYELDAQWMCATGNIINELLTTWHRRAFQHYSLHVFPIPCNPFPPPYSHQCNPLRGPIDIPLDYDCLKDGGEDPFKLFAPKTWSYRLFLLQVAIVERFGFTLYLNEDRGKLQNQFVHVSGSMFVMIYTPGIYGKADEISIPNDYIFRPSSYTRVTSPEVPGFLWVFNHMLSKKFRSQSSGDEIVCEKFLRDFKDFCANKNGRLRNMWDSFGAPISDTTDLSNEP